VRQHWTLQPDIVFLNHGSFGATPRVVLDVQQQYRAQMEREPVRFLTRELEPLLDAARRDVAKFVGADPEGLVFVQNNTTGVNAVLRSLDLDRFDELVVTNQEYNASRNVLEFVASASGSKIVVVDIPFPMRSSGEVTERVLAAVTERTRLVLIDHVTSQTAVINPIAEIVAALNARGIDTLVDGAHAPGMIPIDIKNLGVAYYTANLHKWVCAPKGSAFLYVRENRRYGIRPTSISHGANSPRNDRSRYMLEFDWTGTVDPSAWLATPAALEFMSTLVEGGWAGVMRRNHELALRGRDILASALRVDPPVPDSMLGSMASLPLPDGTEEPAPPLFIDPLQDRLLDEFRIEVPVMPWPRPPKRMIRISAQLYNSEPDYERLAEALTVSVQALPK
jgi:isopenicillin-N epimerase